MAYTDPRSKPALVIARRRIQNMERSHLWYASIRGADDRRLVQKMRRPFMNFKEARNQLAALLGVEPNKIQFEAFKGQRTMYFPEDPVKLRVLLDKITEPVLVTDTAA